jgi:catechol 2,3-dioxygenase-like lactoylglutathione lyase family enzyme
VAIIVRDIEQSLKLWTGAFGLEECRRDDLTTFGLSNALLPVGDQFIELLQVEDAGSSGARFLERRGEGLYILVLEGSDIAGLERHLEENQIPVVYRIDREGYHCVHIHPKAMNRAFVTVDDPMGPGRWPPAGDDWQKHVRTDVLSSILTVGLLTENADADVGRWHRLFGVIPDRYWVQNGLRICHVPLIDPGSWVEFLQPVGPAAPAAKYLQRFGPGLYHLGLATPDLDAALARAQAHGVQVTSVSKGEGGGSAWLHPKTTNGVLIELIERR